MLLVQDMSSPRRSLVNDPSLILVDFDPEVERRLADVEDGKGVLDREITIEDGMDSGSTNLRRFSFHAAEHNRQKIKRCDMCSILLGKKIKSLWLFL